MLLASTKVKNTKYIFILLLLVSVGLISTNLCYSSDNKTKIPDWLKRIDIGVDVGTGQKPRIYFETVQPLYQRASKQNTFFIQPRYSLESGDSAYNLGLGYRRLLHNNSVLLGINSFFDYQDPGDHYRIGFGIETFINQIEFRGNSYIGLSPRRKMYETSSIIRYEKAADGLDAELGLPLPYLNWIKVHAGGYWYNYENFSDKGGWKIRSEIKPFRFSTINLIVYDDNKGDTEVRVDARVAIPFEVFYGKDKLNRLKKLCNIGFSKKAYPEKIYHITRTLDRVEREYKIEVEKWTESKIGGVIVEIKRGN
ncbi:MAG TPA: hypothetical protein EYP21_08600 [Syntrophaceae bacterium]|nr:hypothetical protein [Syntrophaceae bacterium]